MKKNGHVIMICTGNTCRSPMAAGLLSHALVAQSEPLKSIPVISAGVSCRSGDPVSANSVAALKKVGIDISNHHSRPLTQEMIDGALAIFGMTERHLDLVSLQFSPKANSIHLLRDFIPGEVEREIADPYGGPYKLYELSRDEMVEAIPSVVAYLKQQLDAVG